MKAIRVHQFGGPEVLRLEEVPTPRPGNGQVLVKMHAIGVNPVDTYIRSGSYPQKPALPYTPGNDGAGVVDQIGKDLTAFRPGDRAEKSLDDRLRDAMLKSYSVNRESRIENR